MGFNSAFKGLTYKDSQFSPQMVSVVLRIVNTYVLVFCAMSVVWSYWVHDCFHGF